MLNQENKIAFVVFNSELILKSEKHWFHKSLTTYIHSVNFEGVPIFSRKLSILPSIINTGFQHSWQCKFRKSLKLFQVQTLILSVNLAYIPSA